MIKPHEKYVELSNSAKEKYPMNRHLGHRAHLYHTAYTKEEEKKPSSNGLSLYACQMMFYLMKVESMWTRLNGSNGK